MAIPTLRTARLAKLAAVPVALLISGLVVGQASYSAYSDTTVNPTNNWSSGTVDLTDDDTGTAMFNATNLKPGATGSKCIAVTSTGSLPSTVKLYSTGYVSTNNLAPSINLTVTQGTGGSFAGGCSGFTPAAADPEVFNGKFNVFGNEVTSFATGRGTWAPTGGASETRVYKFDYTVWNDPPNTTQGGSVKLGFTWEAQNS